MHRVAPANEAALDVPFVHIIDVLADEARRRGLRTLGLLGTLPVMEADHYREVSPARPAGAHPAGRGPRLVERSIFDELTRHVFTDG